MLRTLGHQKAFLVDSGFAALLRTGFPTVNFAHHTSSIKGDFVVNRSLNWQITQRELKAELENDNLAIVGDGCLPQSELSCSFS